MAYLHITIPAPAEQEEHITMLMFAAGADGVAVEDPAAVKAHLEAGAWDASVFDGKNIVIGRVTLTCVLPDDAAGRAAARQLAHDIAPLPQTYFCCEQLPDTDWLAQWKQGFYPRPIGGAFWLAPVWDKTTPPDGLIPLIVEPGMAFGTGDHATTAMALALLGEYQRPGDTLLDLGCGSGILAIAGKKLGCGPTLAVDMDPVCREAVAHHCCMNGLAAGDIPCLIGDILTDEALRERLFARRHRLVTANINAAAIIALLPVASRLLEAEGLFLCSGVIQMYREQVERAFAESALDIIETREEAGWLAYAARLSR